MNFEAFKARAGEKLEFFQPASKKDIDLLRQRYAAFELDAYVQLLEHSNGVDELFCEGKHSFVHNMLLFNLAEAIRETEAFGCDFLIVGAPGVDGIRYGLKPKKSDVLAYLPIDQEYVLLADSVPDLIVKWLANDLYFHRHPSQENHPK